MWRLLQLAALIVALSYLVNGGSSTDVAAWLALSGVYGLRAAR